MVEIRVFPRRVSLYLHKVENENGGTISFEQVIKMLSRGAVEGIHEIHCTCQTMYEYLPTLTNIRYQAWV